MLSLPDPKSNPFLHESPPIRVAKPTPASLADLVVRLDRKQARRSKVFSAAGAAPVRWLRAEPRPSIQYAGHMATTAARDARLVGNAKAALQILRARSGHGMTTETCKTTLAHIMGVCTRTVGRYLADLIRFGYIETRARRGQGGLYTGLVVTLTEKVLPCFRKAPWLSGWLAQNMGTDQPVNGANPDRTELSHTNHSSKEFLFERRAPLERRP